GPAHPAGCIGHLLLRAALAGRREGEKGRGRRRRRGGTGQMKKKLIRRALALACAASLCLLCAAPVFAATDFQQWSVTKVKLKIPGEGYDRATLTGPDV